MCKNKTGYKSKLYDALGDTKESDIYCQYIQYKKSVNVGKSSLSSSNVIIKTVDTSTPIELENT